MAVLISSADLILTHRRGPRANDCTHAKVDPREGVFTFSRRGGPMTTDTVRDVVQRAGCARTGPGTESHRLIAYAAPSCRPCADGGVRAPSSENVFTNAKGRWCNPLHAIDLGQPPAPPRSRNRVTR